MLLVADENVPAGVVTALRAEGHEVKYILEFARGSSDPTVLTYAVEAGAVVLTSDLDFGALVWQRRMKHAGVLLVRLESLSTREQAERIAMVLRENGARLQGAFSVLSVASLRIRVGPGN